MKIFGNFLKDDENIQITSLLSYQNTVWVGTADGYLIIYEVCAKPELQNFAAPKPEKPSILTHDSGFSEDSSNRSEKSAEEFSADLATNNKDGIFRMPLSASQAELTELNKPKLRNGKIFDKSNKKK